ncbi:MAG: polysaccharide biosynthesis protein [Spirochaetaceae bacterium]
MKRTPRVYIIGAGFAGVSLALELKRKEVLGEVVAFLDDDPDKIGTRLEGVPVLGPIDAVVTLLDKQPTDEALIALPAAGRDRVQKIYGLLEQARFSRIRILPSLSQIVDGNAHMIQTREVDPQDLLGRTPVHIDLRASMQYLRGKRVVVTGAGGSIGSELCRQLLSGGAQRLYLFGHGENAIYEIDRELRLLQDEGVGERASIVPVIGEIQDRDYMHFILNRLRADVVLHTAAYKHVPLGEDNPVETIRNNVFGTKNLIDAASAAGVERVVFISTDKVVEPLSIYGASKRIAEEIVLSATENGHTYMAVRFGNVLSARGSIVPLFQKQIRKGGPVTLTHPDTTRFYMTIPEAASLVLKTGGVGEPGGLYLLDMGEPVKIRELAEQLITIHGFKPYEEIDIEIIGMRRGERLHEALLAHGETAEPTTHQKILRISRNADTRLEVPTLIEELRPVCYLDPLRPGLYRNRRALRTILSRYIPSLPSSPDEPEF